MTADATIATPTTQASTPGSGFRARLAGYLVDMIVLSAFTMVFFVLGGFVLLALSDFGTDDVPEGAYWAFLSILISTVIFWSAFNLALLRWRGQTAGQYVSGLRVVSADGQTPPLRDYALWWVALNPLLFNPITGIPYFLFSAVVVLKLLLGNLGMVLTTGPAFVCVVVPIATIVTALAGDRRPLHDRLSGLTVVAAE